MADPLPFRPRPAPPAKPRERRVKVTHRIEVGPWLWWVVLLGFLLVVGYSEGRYAR